MNLSTIRQMLNERRKWWEATAEHTAEQATMDAQSKFAYDLAVQKLAAISQTEKRIVRGAFGLCDRCGGVIDDGRLEIVLENECHYCVACAAELAVAHATRKPARLLNSHRVGLQPVLHTT